MQTPLYNNLYFILFILFYFPNAKDSNITYFKYTNLAELSIIDSKYEDAVKWYKKAFKCNYPGFSDDHYNAFKVAILTKNIDFAFKNAYVLGERGMCIDFFDDYSLLHQSPKHWETLTELIKKSPSKTNQTYKFALGSLFNDDQSVRQEVRQNREDRQKTFTTDSLNYLKFKELIQKYGFPSEEKIGIECTENHKGIQPAVQYILLLHFAQNKFSGMDTLISKALQQKQLSPYNYAEFIQFMKTSARFYPSPIIKINGIYYTRKLDKTARNKVNRNRLEIGLSSLEDQIQKVENRLANPDNGFRIYTPVDQYSDLPPSLVDSLFVKIDPFIHKNN